MAYTKFGEYMRILRIKHHEVMGDIAKLIGVTLPFLSAVENGRKNVPSEWVDKIVEHYSLKEEEVSELLEAIEQSKTQMKLDLKSASIFQRTAALQFARSFEDMDEETAKKIMQLLENSGIHVIAPKYAGTNLDTPALSAEIESRWFALDEQLEELASSEYIEVFDRLTRNFIASNKLEDLKIFIKHNTAMKLLNIISTLQQ